MLASASPRRRELLVGADIAHRVCPADVDETCAPDLTAEATVLILAERKARQVACAEEGT